MVENREEAKPSNTVMEGGDVRRESAREVHEPETGVHQGQRSLVGRKSRQVHGQVLSTVYWAGTVYMEVKER